MNFFLVYPFRLVGISVLALLLTYALKGDELRSFFVNPHNSYESSPGSSAEVLIIDGSHAGLSAALTLARHQIDVLILDSNAPRNKWKTSTHVVPTWEGRNPDDLRRASQKELQKTGFASFADTHITTIEKPGVNESMFTARDSHGGEWSGRKLLIAAGVEFVFPLIKGYEENFPDRILHCSFTRGLEYKGSRSAGLLATGLADGHLVLPGIDFTRRGLKILDSGTADGHWISELRKKLPNPSIHTYIGTDINPALFPKPLPLDTSFGVHNIADEWPADMKSTFDLVRQRLTLPGAAPTPLPLVIRQLYGLLKPGGWIQLVEAEQEGPGSGPVFQEFLDLVRGLFTVTGAGWHYASVDMAFGAKNPKKVLAEMSARCTAKAMDGLVAQVKRVPSLHTSSSVEKLETLGGRLLDELVEKGAYYRIRCVWGRKPDNLDAM